jgi:L-ascorbate metabolism protein UlaG (beta-lactamase superfamily)
MAVELTWYGHATWLIQTASHRILLDPFLNDNPATEVTAESIELSPSDLILVSHGHFDHIADAASIANRTGAKVVTNFEIAQWLEKNHDVSNSIGMNIGGTFGDDFGQVKMVPAIHSSGLPDGSYGGTACGFVLTLGDPAAAKRIYFACDTALFSDMSLIGDAELDAGILPIGDLFTMGLDDSIAATKLVRPKTVLPTHYNTWPPIEQDAEQWAERVRKETDAVPHVLKPGETFSV